MVEDPRFLRPVRKPFRHIRMRAAGSRCRACGSSSSSRPRRARPVATGGLETRLATILEPHDLRALGRLRPGSDPHEMEMHLASFLS
jgi:hypothetical protein